MNTTNFIRLSCCPIAFYFFFKLTVHLYWLYTKPFGLDETLCTREILKQTTILFILLALIISTYL